MWPTALFLAPLLAAASVIDLRTHRIPNWLNLIGSLVACSLLATNGWRGACEAFAWALVLFLALGSLSIWRPDGFGMGDAKLAAVLALFLGHSALTALVVASVAALTLGAIGRLPLDRGIAFAPFLAAGALASLALG